MEERKRLVSERTKVEKKIDERRNMLRRLGEWPDTINTTTTQENPKSDSGLDPQPLTLSSYASGKVIPATRGFAKWDENLLAALDDNAWLTDEIINFGTWFHPALD